MEGKCNMEHFVPVDIHICVHLKIYIYTVYHSVNLLSVADKACYRYRRENAMCYVHPALFKSGI